MKKISTVFLLAGLYLSPQVQGQVTYDKVASIFYAHCTVCHNSGGIAPFPLMNYSEASSFSASIANAVGKGIMPPWHADSTYVTSGRKGSRFLHENSLTSVEKNAILQWVADGAKEGDVNGVPTAPRYGDMTYKLNGKANLTVRIPDFASNATATSNPYNCFSVPTNLTEDKWLRAFEIVPGNLKAVHHVVISVDTTGSVASKLDGNCAQQPGEIGLGGWSSGAAPTVFPNDPTFKAGVRIPKGSNIILQIHYAPGSGGLIDSTKIRLFFYDNNESNIRSMHSDVMLQNWNIVGQVFGAVSIPKDQVTKFKANSTTLAPAAHAPQPAHAMSIFAVNPHSHNVCTQVKNYAYDTTASGPHDTIPIISITNWDYGWQGNYYFPKMLKIPFGYKLESEHVFDNTVNNHHLPGPPVNVNFGQATADEMLFDAFVWFDYQPGDENIDIKALLADEPLLKVGIDKIEADAAIQYFIYPNPASDNVSINIGKKSVYNARIYNIAGQTVLQTETFFDKLIVDVAGIPSGLYVIEIIDTKTNERVSNKLIISN